MAHRPRCGAVLALSLGAAVLAAEPIPVVVELATPSTVALALQDRARPSDFAVAATGVARAQAARVQREQDDLLTNLRGAGIATEELFRARHTLNGVALLLDESELAAVRALPGVRAVRRLIPKYLSNSSSVRFVGAPEVWNPQGPNATGTGVRVGIIDTGIDYVHKNFGGTGDYSGQKYTDSVVPWTATVVGGHDFVGDDYGTSGGPKPDPDPMDCNSHGTHVAGTVAGLGLDSDGNTYRGAYSPGMGLGAFRLGPGVAPGARLYALRVFGCRGGSTMLIPALEWALDPNHDGDLSDHLDVVNLSLGSPDGTVDDPEAEAVERLVEAGVVVVVAAGNEADGTFMVGSPAVADGAIAVAAVGDSGIVDYLLTVNSPTGLGTAQASSASFGPPLAGNELTGDLVRANPSKGCTPFTNAAAMAGKIAIVDRGDCTFVIKVKNAQIAGAAAALIANNTGGIINMIGDDPTITIPSMSLTQDDGNALKSKLPTPGVNLTLTKYAYADVIADFSSRGPRHGDLALKPDLAAPGIDITSAADGSSDGTALSSRTSMATPHVTGGVALLRQLHPSWPPAWVKAALVNTAAHEIFAQPNLAPPRVGPARAGAGRMDLARAATTRLLAMADDDSDRINLSFGDVPVLGHAVAERRVRVFNTSELPQTLTLAFVAAVDMPGVAIRFPQGPTLQVPATGEATFVVQLVASAAEMKRTPDPSLALTIDGNPRSWLAEESGVITLTPTDLAPIVLPVYAAPRPAAAMQATLEGGAPTFSLALTGTGVDTGTDYPHDVVSLVSAFELAEESPDDEASTGNTQAADLRLIGVATDYPALKAQGKTLADSRIYFGIATQAAWSTPSDVRFDVLVDTDRNGSDDVTVYTADVGRSEGTGGDLHVAYTCRGSSACMALHLNGVAPNLRDTALYGTNVVVVPVPASILGLDESSPRFHYKVRTYSTWGDGQVDISGSHGFDLTKPGLVFSGTGHLGTPATMPLFADLPGNTITATLDAASYQLNASRGVLLLHHHNLAGQREQVVAMGEGACALRCAAHVPTWGAPGVPLAFTPAVTAGGCAIPALTWDFGDGSAAANGGATTHTFASSGSYTWRLQAQSGSFTCSTAGTLDISATPPRFPRRHLGGSSGGS